MDTDAVLYALLSAAFAALTSILAKVGIDGVNSNLATAIRTVVVVIMTWVMVFLTNVQGGISDISKKSWLFLILSGLATGASWLCYYNIDIGICVLTRKIHNKILDWMYSHWSRNTDNGFVKS